MAPSSGGSTTTVQKADPWVGVQPYIKDLMKQAEDYYNSTNNLSDDQKKLIADQQAKLQAQGSDASYQNAAKDILSGKYNTDRQNVADAQQGDKIAYNNAQQGDKIAFNDAKATKSQYKGMGDAEHALSAAINTDTLGKSDYNDINQTKLPDATLMNNAAFDPQSAVNQLTKSIAGQASNQFITDSDKISNQVVRNQQASVTNAGLDSANGIFAKNPFLSQLVAARQSQGSVDPTAALKELLTGSVDNPYLAAANKANIDQSMQGYNDMLQKLQQTVLPQIGDQAVANGQYGSSRHGIAEGLALQEAQRTARDLTQSNVGAGSKLYADAYNQAQNQKAQTALELNQQAGQNSQFNVNNQNQNQQFYDQLLQQVNLANQAAANQNQQFNASNANDLSKFNAQLGLDASKTNAANNLAAQQFNVLQQNDINKQNAQNFNNMSQFNAQNNTQNSQFNAAQSNNIFNQLTNQNLQNQQQAYLTNAQAQNNFALNQAQLDAARNTTNAANQLQNSQFNATALNNAMNQNANYLQQTGIANMQADNAQKQFDANNYMANSQFNAGQANNMAQFNAQNNLAANQYNSQQQQQNNQFNAQNNLAANQYNSQQQQQNNQFNANLGLQNNNYALQQNAQNMGNQLTGLNTLNQGYQTQNQNYNSLMSLANAPQDQRLNALNAFSALINGGTYGGQTTGQTTQSLGSGGMIGNLLGGGLGAAGLGKVLGLF
jgi:hypothetical protein